MPDQCIIQKQLIAALKKRGAKSEIARCLGVAPSTVARWETCDIPTPIVMLLDCYFNGVQPPTTKPQAPKSTALEKLGAFLDTLHKQ